MSRWEKPVSPATPQQVYDAALAVMRETLGDRWVTKYSIESDIARRILSEGAYSNLALDGQITRAMEKIVADTALGFVKAKKGTDYVQMKQGPALEDGTDMWAEQRNANDPMFTTVEHRDQCIAAQPLWDAERQKRWDYSKGLAERAGLLGLIGPEFHVTGSYHYKYPSGFVTLLATDLDRLMEAAEKWL